MIANPLVQFVLAWVDDDGGEAVHTLARLSVRLNGRPIWPADGEPDVAVEIYVDDLLSHLTEFWKPLMLRQTFPVAGAPNRPSQIRAVAEQRWAELPPAIVEQEEENLTAFEQAHDLSRAFAGVYDLPFFYMFRAADVMVLETPWGEWTAGFAAVAVALAAAEPSI